MVPVAYTIRNLIVRWRTTLMTASGFALVVAALVVMLAFVNGVRKVSAASGDPQNVVVTAEGNLDEVFSQLDNDIVRRLSQTEGVLRDAQGAPLASPELFTVLNVYNNDKGVFEFLHIRGVSEDGARVHQDVTMQSGRWFRPGRRELILGAAAARGSRFQPGSTIPVGAEQWTIVGVFTAEGAAFESELWCDLGQLASTFRREGFVSSLVLRTGSPEDAAQMLVTLEESKNAGVAAHTEPDYYHKQTEQMQALAAAAWIIALFMGLGSVFGVMNTMFAAISQRKSDIAVMRILGFSRLQILTAFMLEAMLVAAVGTCVGAACGSLINGMSQSMLVGSRDLQFTFFVEPVTMAMIAAFSVALGVIGGLVPAVAAMRVSALEALRS